MLDCIAESFNEALRDRLELSLFDLFSQLLLFAFPLDVKVFVLQKFIT
jgi:hypothetical protein